MHEVARQLEAGAEARAHRALSGEGHDNVLGMEGVVRTPSGQLCLALEVAPGGDMLEFAQKLKAKVGDVVTLHTPSGQRDIEVIEVTYPERTT